MGMYGKLVQISPQRLQEFKKNPKLAHDQVLPHMTSARQGYESYPTDTDSVELQGQISAAQKATQNFDVEKYRKDALAAMKRANSRNPRPFPEPVLEESIDRVVAAMHAQHELWQGSEQEVRSKLAAKIDHNLFSLEKNWHMLHFALNGTAEGGEPPLADAILGGKELPSHDAREDYGPLRYLTPHQVAETAAALAKVDGQNILNKIVVREAKLKHIYLAETLDDLESWSYLPELFKKFQSFYQEAATRGNAMLLKIV